MSSYFWFFDAVDTNENVMDLTESDFDQTHQIAGLFISFHIPKAQKFILHICLITFVQVTSKSGYGFE